MRVEDHHLHHEFPEFAQRIKDLMSWDSRFAKILGKYDKVNDEIRRLESADMPVADTVMEKMKLERVLLKDWLYAYLKAQAPATGRGP